MTNGGRTSMWWVALSLVLVLAATACTGSATVTQTSSPEDDQAAPTSTALVATEPTPPPTSQDSATAVPTSPPSGTGPPVVILADESFRADSLLGLSPDGAFGYAGTSSPWSEPTSCDAAPQEALAVIDVVAAEGGDVQVTATGLEQVGDVRRMIFNDNGAAAILSSCGTGGSDVELWLHRADIGSDGRIATLGERIDLDTNGDNNPWLVQWVDNSSVEVRVAAEQEPDDADAWFVEQRQLSIDDGRLISSERVDIFDDDGLAEWTIQTTAQEHTYRAIDDQSGGLGCEGFGIAVTLELDTGSERRLALTQPDLVFSEVRDLHVSAQNYISWTSGCEGFVSAYVGRVRDDGTIVDAHLVETFNFSADRYVDFQHYRLTNDGFLHALGQSFDDDFDQGQPAFLRYDLGADPHFVNSADPTVQIDQEPLATAVAGDGSWHVGDTLAKQEACGGRTLYGQTPGGFFRAFPAGFEMDTIVDVDVAETRRISYPEGDYISRTIVVQTECPESYEGRRVWFGIEANPIVWGLTLQPADLGEVADVLLVREVLEPGTDFIEATIIQVELLSGGVAEVELVRLPNDS